MFLTIPTSAISSSSSNSPSSFSSSSCSPSSLIFSFLPLSFCLSSANLSLLFFLEIWGFPGIFLTEKKIGLVHHRYWKLEMRAGEISSCDKSTQWGQSLVGIGSLPSKSSKSDKDKYETKNWDKDIDLDSFTDKEKWVFNGLILVVCKGKSSKSELKWSVTKQFFVLRFLWKSSNDSEQEKRWPLPLPILNQSHDYQVLDARSSSQPFVLGRFNT